MRLITFSTRYDDARRIGARFASGILDLAAAARAAGAAPPPRSMKHLPAEGPGAMERVRERMLTFGADPAGDTPEAFARFIHEDQAKWSRLMKKAGIALE